MLHRKLSKGLKNDAAACMTLQAEKELRQKAEQAQTEALEAADGQEAHMQALQQQLSQAAARVNDVPVMETQLAAVRSRLEKALEDLQVSQALPGTSCCRVQGKLSLPFSLPTLAPIPIPTPPLPLSLPSLPPSSPLLSTLPPPVPPPASFPVPPTPSHPLPHSLHSLSPFQPLSNPPPPQLLSILYEYACQYCGAQEETALQAKAEADADHAQKAASDQAAAMESLQDELEAAQAVAQEASLLEHQLAATKAQLDTALSNVQVGSPSCNNSSVR